jgi:general stress protein 26
MKRVVREQRLGFVATVCPDGTPNLSPKGTTTVWDDDHLVFAHLYSPNTVENLRHNPAIEFNVVDVFSRKGYRFKGTAEVLTEGPLYERIMAMYRGEDVYDNYFSGRMEENPAFQTWCTRVFLQRYPTPPRAPVAFDTEEAARQGSRLVGQERYQNVVTFSPEMLIDYLVTQTNVIAAVEGGCEHLADVRHWLMDSITPLFENREEAHFLFQGPIWYLQKANV